jgi:YidC/Oxa1 family membrane protein insertase
MDREHLVQFIVATAAVLLIWWGVDHFLLGRGRGPAGGLPPGRRQPVQPVVGQVAGGVPPAEPAGEPSVAPVHGIVLASQHIRTEWTSLGASLQKLTILDEQYRAPYHEGDTRPELVLLNEFQRGTLSDTILQVRVALLDPAPTPPVPLPTERVVYSVSERTEDRVVFGTRLALPGVGTVVLRKTVTMGDGYGYRVEIDAENQTTSPVAVGFSIRGAAGIERESLKTTSLGTRVARAEGGGVYGVTKRAAAKLDPTDADPVRSRRIAWAAVVNHYFAAVLRPGDLDLVESVESVALTDEAVRDARGRWDVRSVRAMGDRSGLAKSASVIVNTAPMDVQPGQVGRQSYELIALPKAQDVLVQYGSGLSELVEMGLFRSLSKLAVWMLEFFHGIIPNYGVAIILLTVAVRIALHPLTRKSQVSMTKLQKLQPQIAEVQKQYGGDREKLAQAQMELWRKYGVSPLSGCGPLFLQLPVFIALFGALRAAIPLRHAAFLWVSDLSAPDTVLTLPFGLPVLGDQLNLLPFLMAAAMFVNQKMTPTPSGGQSEQQQKLMKWFPLFFVLLLYRVPSGVCLYWTCSTAISILERLLIERKTAGMELVPLEKQRRRDQRRGKSGPEKLTWIDRLQKIAEDKSRAAERAKRARKRN